LASLSISVAVARRVDETAMKRSIHFSIEGVPMAYANNAFCWHGVVSTDINKATAFYREVIGWSVLKTPMGEEEATLFAASDIPRAHVMAPPMEGVPSHWDNYLRVDDVDARAAAAVAKGGRLVVPPTDIPVGRFSVVASPSGAHLSLFHEKDEATAQNAPAGHGSIHWVELHSKDIEADLAWLKLALDIEHETVPMPAGDYFILKSGSTQIGGATVGMKEEAPAMWLAWIQVDDVDACVERVGNHGGNTLSPTMDVQGVGRMAVVQDNTGGVFGVITPA